VLRQVVIAELDTSLLSIADQHQAILKEGGPLNLSIDRQHKLLIPHFVQLIDRSGRVIDEYGLDEGTAPMLSPDQLRSVVDGGVLSGDSTTGGLTSRISAVRGERGGQPVAVVIGTATDTLNKISGRIAVILLVIDLVAIAAAILGGYSIVGNALRPIDHITDRARQIGAGDLRRRLEYMDSSAEMVHLTSVLNEMFDKLQRLFESQKQFVQDAAHEIRSPLAALRCRLEVALRQPRPAEAYTQVIEDALHDATRLSSLADDLLLLARADSDNLGIDFREVSLSQVVSSVYNQLLPLAEAKLIDFELKLKSDCFVYGDKERLQQAFRNLAENALKYTPASGSVAMTVELEADDACVTVEDTGIGIPAEEQKDIFRRFYRVDRARSRKDGGTGLGLAICEQIIRAHKGNIELQSEPGRGSKFTVHLASASSLIEAATV
jgi:heavy metal sensor kinase